MWFSVVTLFPEMLDALISYGVTGQAVKKGLIQVENRNPRDFTHDRHRTVDDRPYGGGPGMLMKVQPLRDAIHSAKNDANKHADVMHIKDRRTKVICLSPQGRKLDQQGVKELATFSHLILVAGRYEGIDERLIESEIDEEWSVGDYVLSGGEIPATLMIDAISRLVPGTLGHKDSAKEDSFAEGLLDCPHYTRPEILAGQRIPDILLTGHHQKIKRWRLKQSLGRTWLKRPDLLKYRKQSEGELKLLNEFIEEYQAGLFDTQTSGKTDSNL